MATPLQLSRTVIFVADVPMMADFYAAVSGWKEAERDNGVARLVHQGQQIVIHKARGVESDEDGGMRVETPMKTVFTAPDRSVLDRVTVAGGQVLTKREFVNDGYVHVDAVDLEGNIFQLAFPE